MLNLVRAKAKMYKDRLNGKGARQTYKDKSNEHLLQHQALQAGLKSRFLILQQLHSTVCNSVILTF